MLHKNSASPLCDWQVKIFIFLTVYLTGSGSSQFVGFSFYRAIGRYVHQIKKNGDLVGGIAMPERLNKHSPNLFQVWRDFYCLQIAISIFINDIKGRITR